MSVEASTSTWGRWSLFTNEELEAECLVYADVEKENTASWEEECKKYEKTMHVNVDGKKKKVPRRNYINKDARVQDSTLFPYHSSCYALLDAYDCLYNNPSKQQPVSKKAVQTHNFPPPPVYTGPARMMPEIQGYLPCSVRAIAAAIFRISQVEGLQHAADIFSELIRNVSLTVGATRADFGNRPDMFRAVADSLIWLPRCFSVTPVQCGPVEFPTDGTVQSDLLLKLLRHSLSEIQRDHLLARAIIARCNAESHLEEVDFLRRVLTVVVSDFIVCEGPCDEPEDHVCVEWVPFLEEIRTAIGIHTQVLTKEHGVALAALLRRLFLREFGHLKIDANHSFGEKMKNELKRSLLMQREEIDDREGELPGSAVPVDLVVAILEGLTSRALMDRQRLNEFLSESDRFPEISDKKIEDTIGTYKMVMTTLATIAEDVVTLLPPVERFYTIGSELVKSITLCLAGQENPFGNNVEAYIGKERTDLEGLASSFRFSDAVQQSAVLKRRIQHEASFLKDQSPRERLLFECRQILHGQPPDDLRVAVRRLFIRDVVHLQTSWMGYGDFLVWCRYEVNPLDPVLFCHEFNYHVDDSSDDESDDSDDDDDESEDSEWDMDENGKTLSTDELRDRFDFSLLALQCAWHQPWKEETHLTFQPGFRTAVSQVALCLQRLGMPRELHGHIVQCFARDWWPDDRQTCWHYDCMLDQLRIQEECRVGGETYVPPPVKFVCDGCRTTSYCSRSCRESDWKDGHKNVCGKPPYRRPTREDYTFCETIRYNDEQMEDVVTITLPTNATGGGGGGGEDMVVDLDVVGDDDDDGSWESVVSDEEEETIDEAPMGLTGRIVNFFRSHYKDR